MASGLVIVSGASSGIGRAAALRLARAGFDVRAGVRNESAAADLRGASRGSLEPILLDIARPESIEAAIAGLEPGLARRGIAGLVNNAGITVSGAVEYLPIAEWQRQFDVNLFGHVDLTRRLLRHVRRARGRVVFVSSVGGFSATPFLAPYCASKFALEGLGDSLRLELAPFGVSVSVVQPGATRTAMLEGVDETADRGLGYMGEDGGATYRQTGEAVREAFRKMGETSVDPDRVARAIEHALTAARPKSRYRVGSDTKVLFALKRFLPSRASDALARRFLNLP